ncbi:MAG: hypothetical protein U0573_07780 [Phycisphaerales bacterium]|nr:hypothetical protein [Planctomycetota bacterium]
MKSDFAFLAVAATLIGACQSTPPVRPVVQAASAEQKQATLGRVKSLAGTWKVTGPKGDENQTTAFTVGGGGSTVREVMFPGTAHEMTNMYHMDGQKIVCTHYCATGNQPRMTAPVTTLDAASASNEPLCFKLEHVSNLRSPDESYMGEMWLTFKDANTVEQRWKSFKGDHLESDVIFTLTRLQ